MQNTVKHQDTNFVSRAVPEFHSLLNGPIHGNCHVSQGSFICA
jgi:hypothetical protein